MGADIHMMVEYASYQDQEGNDMWWDFGGHINPGRDYDLFGFIADVRGEGPAIVEPRDLPERMSWRAREYFENDGDLHSLTWLTLKELERCVRKRERDTTYGGVNPGYHALMAAMRAFEKRGIKTRVIIGFDN